MGGIETLILRVANALASEGIEVTLLERGDVGRGSTVASSALLLQEPTAA